MSSLGQSNFYTRNTFRFDLIDDNYQVICHTNGSYESNPFFRLKMCFEEQWNFLVQLFWASETVPILEILRLCLPLNCLFEYDKLESLFGSNWTLAVDRERSIFENSWSTITDFHQNLAPGYYYLLAFDTSHYTTLPWSTNFTSYNILSSLYKCGWLEQASAKAKEK